MITKATVRFNLLSLTIAIIFAFISCNGHDASGKNESDTARATATVPAVDSVKAKKTVKKKGQLSVTMTGSNGEKIVKDASGIYNRAEVAPEFPGGQAALSNYINNHLAYSQTAIDNNVSGTMHVMFVVDEHGKVLDAQAVDGKNMGDDMVNETLKVFNDMPLWKPGLVHGKKVKSRLQIPVTFQLADAE